MEELTATTQIMLTTWQFIGIIIFLVTNVATVVGAWYRFGFRLSVIERNHNELKDEVDRVKSFNARPVYEQLRKEFDIHIIDAKCSQAEVSRSMEEIKVLLVALQKSVDIHLAIHNEKEKKIINN
jgi:hypothetical protein